MSVGDWAGLIGLLVAITGIALAYGLSVNQMRLILSEFQKTKVEFDSHAESTYKIITEASTDVLGAIAAVTEAIRADGEETRRSIREAHRDIKTEMLGGRQGKTG